MDKMTEIKNSNRTKLKLQKDKYQQLELLFEIYIYTEFFIDSSTLIDQGYTNIRRKLKH